MSNKSKVRTNLTILALVFFLPLIFGWVFYIYAEKFEFNTKNKGQLLSPLVEFKKTKTWLIAYVSTNCCNKACAKALFQLHQLHTSLGRDWSRVSIGLFQPQNIHENCVINNFQDIKTYDLSKNEFLHLSSRLNQQQNKINLQHQGAILLVDPMGNAFMYYPTDANPMNILKDVKHVLEVSQIG